MDLPSLDLLMKAAFEAGGAAAGGFMAWKGVRTTMTELGRRMDAVERTNATQTGRLEEHSKQDMEALSQLRTDSKLVAQEVSRQGRAIDRLTERFGTPMTSPGLANPMETPPPTSRVVP